MLSRVPLFCQLQLTQSLVTYVSVCTLICIILRFASFCMLIIATDLKDYGNLFCYILRNKRLKWQHVLSIPERYYVIAGDQF